MYWRRVRRSRFVAGLPNQMRGLNFDCFLGDMGVGIFTYRSIKCGKFTMEEYNENYGGYPLMDRRRFKRLFLRRK